MNAGELRDALRRDAELVGDPPGDLVERIEGLRRRSNRRRAAVLGVALLVGAVPVGGALLGQEDGSQVVAPPDPLLLTVGDACGDASFYATAESGEVAVWVRIEARDRSRTEPLTRTFIVPDATVTVEVLEGERLGNFCTDFGDPGEVRIRRDAVAGAGSITLDPLPVDPATPCGTVTGDLELSGLVAEDGTTFAPIRVVTDRIGCVDG